MTVINKTYSWVDWARCYERIQLKDGSITYGWVTYMIAEGREGRAVSVEPKGKLS
jgi:hypothetical protein